MIEQESMVGERPTRTEVCRFDLLANVPSQLTSRPVFLHHKHYIHPATSASFIS
jgi:hypothetical protein